MTPAEHYVEAEKLLDHLEEVSKASAELIESVKEAGGEMPAGFSEAMLEVSRQTIALAHVHAVLSNCAAVTEIVSPETSDG